MFFSSRLDFNLVEFRLFLHEFAVHSKFARQSVDNMYFCSCTYDGKIMKVRKKCPCNSFVRSFVVFIVCSIRIFFSLLLEQAKKLIAFTVYALHHNHNHIDAEKWYSGDTEIVVSL